jgi:NADP-dependent aldehyde dehydrogenase
VSDVKSIDPRTGRVRATLGPETTRDEVDAACVSAQAAFQSIRKMPRTWRAKLLRAMAEGLEVERTSVVATADAETALGLPRLNGELTRTIYQLRLFADVVEEGSFLEATIDHAGPTDMGLRPDLRRMLVATGPVGMFGASNFPLAFSVPGGDTAAALAAGCSVVVKVHESHPDTSRVCIEILQKAAATVGAPEGTVGAVYGRAAGARLVQHPLITAVSFTGSVGGGRALMRLIDERPSPIPFYGELGSINPLVVTPAATDERAEEIGQGLVGSITLGVGQFCTKPGLAFVPSGPSGDALVRAAATAVAQSPAGVMLNSNMAVSFARGVSELVDASPVRAVSTGLPAEGEVLAMSPILLEVSAASLSDEMFEEHFGPMTLLVRYESGDELLRSIERLPSSLTATLHTATDESLVSESIRRALEARAGRVVYNGYPTGVAVAWAQNHGGGWPATNSVHTSVGTTSARRFLRPITWQDAPAEALPVELRDETVTVPRRVDGVLRIPAIPTPGESHFDSSVPGRTHAWAGTGHEFDELSVADPDHVAD